MISDDKKGLETKAKSYEKEKQKLSQLSLPFDFKIQVNQNWTSSKKLKVIPTEVIIRKDTINCHPFLLKATKDATINFESSLPISEIDLHSLQIVHIYNVNKNLSRKYNAWIGGKLLSTTSDKSPKIMPIMSQPLIHLLQYPLYVHSSEQFMLHLKWDFYIMSMDEHVNSVWFIPWNHGTISLVYVSAKSVWDMNQK